MLRVISHKRASRHGRPRPYLARLSYDGEHLIREFVNKAKAPTGGTVQFAIKPIVGDIYEARAWEWDPDRECYIGGTLWLGVQQDRSLVRFTRHEALTAAFLKQIPETDRTNPQPKSPVAQRMLPEYVRYEQA